jgi:carbon storage regulator CsrA
MLVLARKKAETILIGETIVIKVLQMRNGVVRIGIDAPSSVRVLRGEVQAGQGPQKTGPLPLPASTSDPEQEADSAIFSKEVAAIEEECRAAVQPTQCVDMDQPPRISPATPSAAPLAAVLRALRVVAPGTEGPAVQLRSPHKN